MHLITKTLLKISLPFMILTYKDYLKITPKTIEGTVVTQNNGVPVEKAFCYIIKGNEEIITNNKGEFKLKTWQELPVTVTIEHAEYKTATVLVENEQQPLKIVLQKK